MEVLLKSILQKEHNVTRQLQNWKLKVAMVLFKSKETHPSEHMCTYHFWYSKLLFNKKFLILKLYDSSAFYKILFPLRLKPKIIYNLCKHMQ